MTIGIPKGLLYAEYHVFAETFFKELGAKIVVSPDTNQRILDSGVQHCIDEACLPIKVFHGHLAYLKNECDAILVPRFLRMGEGKSVCPMFCGLIEMVSAGIAGLPRLVDNPIHSLDTKAMQKWAHKAGKIVTPDAAKRQRAFNIAMAKQRAVDIGINDTRYSHKVALIGHGYNIYDQFINMNLVEKLRRLGLGTVTRHAADRKSADNEVHRLFKRPFWYFARDLYGAAVHLAKARKADGIIYVSAFCCGIDSVMIELIKAELGEYPMMVLKIDEHTGEAGLDTRIEAFADMIKRRPALDNNCPSYGECVPCSQSAV